MIPPLIHGWVLAHYPLIARAFLVVVVYNPAGLQMGVDRNCADILEAAFLQILTDLVGQTVTDRDRPCIMPLIEDCFTAGIRPDVVTETAILLPHFLITPCIIDYRMHFAGRADHAFRLQDTLHVCFVVSSDFVKIKIVKALPEDFPLFQHQIPGKAALQAFQRQMFEHMTVIMYRNSPFRIMINAVGLVHTGPGTVSHFQVLHQCNIIIPPNH